MNQIIIAKKVSHNNVEFLDFAVDENDNLITFLEFSHASSFLKKELSDEDQLLDFLITTIEAQQNNPRLQVLLNKTNSFSPVQQAEIAQNPSNAPTECVSVSFTLDCSDFELVNSEIILNKLTGQQLIPVIAFVDPQNPQQPVPVTNLILKSVEVQKV